MTDRFAISSNEEIYYGSYGTIEEAIDDAVNSHEYTVFWVGRCVPATQPEEWWNAEDWLEHVSCQDDYSSEWAEDWDDSTKEQRAELEGAVRKVMADWLDKHNLRPKFYNIVEAVKYIVSIGGKPFKAIDLLS
jgi:hypothetical protein